MRIILKPAGLGVLVLALSVLIYVALTVRHGSRVIVATPIPTKQEIASVATENAATTDMASVLNNRNLLLNGGFEATQWDLLRDRQLRYRKTAVETIQGRIAFAWEDNSEWVQNLAVHYAPDAAAPHGGRWCQRIEVGNVPRNSWAQFRQTVNLPRGQTYEVRAWVRASRSNAPLSLGLRQPSAPFRYFAQAETNVGESWTPIEMKVTADDVQSVLIFCLKNSNTIYWIDDVSVTPAIPVTTP